ncbi:hypothetical protein RA2_02516 [Roseovarius sp. A-2]|nr:hypothetical protein RA2_02516 [Roseovarius sp. A-2]
MKSIALLSRGSVVSELAPGILLAMVVAAAAGYITDHYGGPLMLITLLLGMALVSLSDEGARTAPGIKFASKRILRAGVALLGLRISLSDVTDLGLASFVLIVAAIGLSIGTGVILARMTGRDSIFGILAGGAVGICGASAALAISSVLQQGKDRETDTIFTVVSVTLLSTIAMVLYPVIAGKFGLDDRLTGIFLGATIHDVAQVVGAGYLVSDEAGDTATVIKLMRVMMLMPVVLSLAFFMRSRDGEAGHKRPLPIFAFVFAALVLANSFNLVPEDLRLALVEASRWCLIIAIGALGMSTRLENFRKVGPRAATIVTGTTLVLLVFVMAALKLTPYFIQ